jgi:ligand-binding sensor domain-containing protein
VTDEHGLVSNYINTIFEDSKGNVWFGTNRGLSVLSDHDITTFTRANGLLDNNVFAISEDKNGAIWVGTARGVNIFVDNEWQYFTFFYQAAVFDIIPLAGEKGMLVGTGGYGVYQFDYTTGKFSVFDFITDCTSCNTINSLFQASDESVWIASSDGVRRIRDSFITRFDMDDGLPGKVATTITEDSWGNIWVGSVEGRTISKIKGNSISQVSFNNGEEQNFIFGLEEDNEGTLWVGTVGNGLFRYDGAIMKQVKGGPRDNRITALLKDSMGNIWVGTVDAGVGQYLTNPDR